MKIILLMTSISTGGAEFSTLSFYGWLKQRPEVEIKIVCLKKALPEYNLENFGFNELIYLNGTSFLSKLKSFNIIVDSFRPDIVHSVLFDANLIGRTSKLLKRNFKHLESLVNQTYSSFRLKDPNVNWTKLQLYRLLDYSMQIAGVDHFHSNGATVSSHYQQKLFINPNRITNIPRGRHRNKFKDNIDVQFLYKKLFNNHNRVILINVARHEHQKAQTILIDALNELPHLKNKYLLLLVGREGNSTSIIKRKIASFKLQDNVSILGHREDVPSLLTTSDIFIFPSRFEGLPGALIEAEAAGLPIICSDIPNNLEVVKENINALTFPVDDYKALSEKISRLILDKEKRTAMGKESFKIFEENFQIKSVHDKMYKLLKNVLAD